MSAYTKPLPRPEDADNAPHWAAARAGKLQFQRCVECGHFRFPAAPVCPRCRARAATWETAAGRGIVESFCRFHKAYWPGFQAELPYLVVQVRLESGVRMYSNLVDVRDDAVRIGMPVEAVFDAVTPVVTLVRFREAQGA